MNTRRIIAIVAAGAGIGTLAGSSSLPAGLGSADPAGLATSILSSGAFWSAALIATAAIALIVVWARRRDESGDYWAWLEPLLWGASAPLLAILLDPWFFHRTGPTLAAAGICLGAIVALLRCDLPLARGDNRSLAIVMLLALLVPTFLVLPGPPWFHPISGDEPHYLVIARSLWVDGDVNVRNEYQEGLMTPFWPGELSPHAKPGADPTARYSIHGSGLAVWLAPWYGLGSGLSEAGFNVMIRIAMALWLAAGAGVLFLLLRDVVSEAAAFPGSLLAVLTLPLVFAGPHLFPAVPVFTLSCGAYLLLRRAPSLARGAGCRSAAGVPAVAALQVLRRHGDDRRPRHLGNVATTTRRSTHHRHRRARRPARTDRRRPRGVHLDALRPHLAARGPRRRRS